MGLPTTLMCILPTTLHGYTYHSDVYTHTTLHGYTHPRSSCVHSWVWCVYTWSFKTGYTHGTEIKRNWKMYTPDRNCTHRTENVPPEKDVYTPDPNCTHHHPFVHMEVHVCNYRGYYFVPPYDCLLRHIRLAYTNNIWGLRCLFSELRAT